MPNVEFSASSNATPASGVKVMTRTTASAEQQVIAIGDASGCILGTSSSPLHAALTGGSVALLAGANTIGVASAIQSGTWNVSASVVNAASVVVTNTVSASISSGSVALLAGANTIGAASSIQSGAWSVSASLVNSGSVVVTNTVSASISSGSVALLAGANTIGSASVIQSTPTGNANGWPVVLTDKTNIFGVPGSPLSQAGQGQTLWWSGSMLTIEQYDISSSISGCTRMVASESGKAIVIVNATFTTSGCQRVGWVASGAGAASAPVQTPMPFGTNGGMDSKRAPDSYLWLFPSGSNAVLTTTSACYLAGTVNVVRVAS